MKFNNRVTVLIITLVLTIFVSLYILAGPAAASKKSKAKSKFYDFSEQLIDGSINKPTALYTDARQKVKFDRLLRLKKSFLNHYMTQRKKKSLNNNLKQ